VGGGAGWLAALKGHLRLCELLPMRCLQASPREVEAAKVVQVVVEPLSDSGGRSKKFLGPQLVHEGTRLGWGEGGCGATAWLFG
jgi:hypothetical protein